jgi:tetratricopeptide (TPR) repeat protein
MERPHRWFGAERSNLGVWGAAVVSLPLLVSVSLAADGPSTAADAVRSGSAGRASSVRRVDDQVAVRQRIGGYRSDLERIDRSVRSSVGPNSYGMSPEQRLAEGKAQLGLNNYEAAAVLLFDAVQRGPRFEVFAEAVYYLGEALFFAHDYLSARRYLLASMGAGRRSPHYYPSIARLLTINLILGDEGEVGSSARYLEELADAPEGSGLASSDYVRGKYLYFTSRWSEARSVFLRVPPANPYHVHARYLHAATLLQEKNRAEAERGFGQVAGLKPTTDGQRWVVYLARLALGRLRFERGDISGSIDAYQAVGRGSPLFKDALYEVAWCYIRSASYPEALRSLELVAALGPPPGKEADLQLLIGNLEVRLGRMDQAKRTFDQVRTKYTPVEQQLETLSAMHDADSKRFFDQLIGREHAELDSPLSISDTAQQAVLEDARLRRSLSVAADVDVLRRSAKESTQLIERIERALATRPAVVFFADLAVLHQQVVEIVEGILVSKRTLANAAKTLAEGGAVEPATREELARLDKEQGELEARLSSEPATGGAYLARAQEIRAKYDEVDKAASRLGVLIQDLEAELAALEAFERQSPQDVKAPLPEVVARQAELRSSIQRLRREQLSIRQDIDASLEGLSASPKTAASLASTSTRPVRDAYEASLDRLFALATGELERRGGGEAAEAGSLKELYQALADTRRGAAGTESRLHVAADQRLVDVRRAVAEERSSAARVLASADALGGKTDALGGAMAVGAADRARDHIHQKVLGAEVGVLDIAWARKQQQTDALSRLVREQKSELKALDQEFQELLKEQEADDRAASR